MGKNKVDLSADRLALLELLLAEEGVDAAPADRIPKRRESGPVPLSYAQQRLWFLDQFEPGNATYNIPAAVRLKGWINIPALEYSLNMILSRHESLRTTYTAVDGHPLQIINTQQTLSLPVLDLEHFPHEQRFQDARHLQEEEAHWPFSLKFDRPIRVHLLRLGAEDHILAVTMHHVASDGWSFTVFGRELAACYDAYLNGETPKLPELPIQYADYALWQTEWLQGDEAQVQLAYWKEKLGGDLPVLEMPTDFPRPPIQSFRGAKQEALLSSELSQAIHKLCQQESVTLFMMMLAAFKLLLHRYSGQDDIIVGSPIAGRNRAEVENLIGLFLNTLVLRTDLSGNPSFRELLRRVRETGLGAFANQDVPFEMLLDELKPERELSRTPLFQVFFNMLNFSEGVLQLPGAASEVLANPTLGSKFDLTLYVSEIGPQIKLLLSYNADLFQEARMVEMVAQYEYLLTQIVANPDQLIDNYSLVTARTQRVLPDPTEPLNAEWFGPTSAALTRNAQRIPQQVAVVDAHDTWTYQELEQRSNQLAHYLCDHGVQPQDVVAIYAHRSASLPWALMGLMKAGAAFLVLDPTYPPARLIDYLELAQPRGWIQLEAAGEPPEVLLDTLDQLGCTCRVVLPGRCAAEQQDLLAGYSVEPPDIVVGPDDFASLSFTSGSTGKPKGTMGRHGSLTHFYPWLAEMFALTGQDRFSMLSGLAHDPLQRDIFTALWVGARICAPDPMQIGSPGWLADWMREQGVTVANLTPAMGQLITDTAVTIDGATQTIPSLRRAFFVGDVLTRRDVARLCSLAPNLTVINFYGSTETQRAVSYYIIEESVEDLTTMRAKEIIPLGRGVKDAQLLLLNHARQLAGVGEVAEIYMRSHHLALRYQGDDAQTAYRFLPNPFTNIPGDRLYRTGDLGRYRPDGNAEFVSRADQQVKIRGFRVELGEINAVLGNYPGVQQALTIARRDDESGHLRLLTYVVPKPDQPELSVTDLRHFLRERFPMYMVPAAFVLLPAIPMTPNGKIDRRALPDPDWGNLEVQDSYTTPRNDVEKRLAAIWEQLLGMHPVGVKDNFFEIGGHSLLAVRLFVRIEQEFGVNLPLTSLFQDATVRHLANLIQTQTGLSTWSSLVEIHPRVNSERPRFFCVHGVTGDVYWFDALARYMGPDQPFYGLQSRGLDGVQAPLGTVEEMAAHYIQEMRTLQPEGPYYIGGYSYGANVAYEMARQLAGQGQQVALLAVLDHMPAKSDYMKVHWNLRLIGHILLNLPYRFQDFLYLRPDEMWARIRKKVRATGKWARNKLSRGSQMGYQAGDLIDSADEFPEHVRKVIESNYHALQVYVPQPYVGEVTLLRAKGGRLLCSHDPEMGWGKLAQGGVKVSVVPGSHLRIFKEPHVRHLAFNLRAVLTAAYQEHGGG